LTLNRPLDEGEPKGLDTAVYQRIHELKREKKRTPADSYQHKNYDAVLKAYRTGKLKPGPATDWLDGQKLDEPLDLTDDEMLRGLLKKYDGKIPLYNESVCESLEICLP
jgi:hypothetical protein